MGFVGDLLGWMENNYCVEVVVDFWVVIIFVIVVFVEKMNVWLVNDGVMSFVVCVIFLQVCFGRIRWSSGMKGVVCVVVGVGLFFDVVV